MERSVAGKMQTLGRMSVWLKLKRRLRDLPGLAYLIVTVMTVGIFSLTHDALMVSLLLLLPIAVLAARGGRASGLAGAVVSAVLTAPFFAQPLIVPALDPFRWGVLCICYLLFGLLIGVQSEKQRIRRWQHFADFEQKIVQAKNSVARYETLLSEMTEGQVFLERVNEELAFLNTIATAVNRSLDFSEVQDNAMEYMANLLRVDEVQIYWITQAGDNLVLQAIRGQDAELINGVPPVRPGDGLLGQVLLHQQVVSVSEQAGDLVQCPPAMGAAIKSIIAIPLRLHTRLSGALVLGRNNGVPFSSSDEQLLDSAGRILAVAIEKARLFKQTQELSMADALTGLPNRRMFNLQLDAEFSRARLTGDPLCLVIFDLDFFKRVNDIYGHLAGDEVLCQFAHRVQQDIRGSDLFCRYGGEEFALIAQNTSLTDTVAIAERINRHISSEPFILEDGTKITLTVSAGVATISEGIDSIDGFITVADQALYAAKAAGRNRVFCCAGREHLPSLVPTPEPAVKPQPVASTRN